VVADDEVFVRSWRGAKGRWYRDLAAGGPATLEAVARASREFLRKYQRSSHAQEMVRAQILPTTLRLEPRNHSQRHCELTTGPR